MEVKSNNATDNRPKGARQIDAPFVVSNPEAIIQQLKEEEAWAKNSRNAITMYKSEGITVVMLGLRKGATLSDNQRQSSLFLHVLEGKLSLSLDSEQEVQEVAAGNLLAVHREFGPDITALEDSFVLMTLTGE